ncbi:hypothetical protein HK405_015190 [Cladochytrium tenue]|nr:hypothetical protein HK405_015190 [Cladochytrium tenue]
MGEPPPSPSDPNVLLHIAKSTLGGDFFKYALFADGRELRQQPQDLVSRDSVPADDASANTPHPPPSPTTPQPPPSSPPLATLASWLRDVVAAADQQSPTSGGHADWDQLRVDPGLRGQDLPIYYVTARDPSTPSSSVHGSSVSAAAPPEPARRSFSVLGFPLAGAALEPPAAAAEGTAAVLVPPSLAAIFAYCLPGDARIYEAGLRDPEVDDDEEDEDDVGGGAIGTSAGGTSQ